MKVRSVVKTRASYLKTYIQKGSFFFLLIFSVLLMAYHRNEPDKIAAIKSSMNDFFVGTMEVMSSPGEAILSFYGLIDYYFFVVEENERLRHDNEQLRFWQQAAIKLEAENQSMRQVLSLKEKNEQAYISAKVIGDSRSPFGKTLILKAGSDDGVMIGQPVVMGRSLVGRIIEAGKHSSRLLLLNDLESHIPVRFLSSGDRAILSGNASGLVLEFISDDAQYVEGDFIVTSGTEGFMPEGLVVGRLKNNKFEVTPMVNEDRLEIVQILNEKRSRYEDLEGFGKE